MRPLVFTLLPALFLARPALAWDPATAASIDAGLAELRAAWEGKDPTAVLADKVQRARQKEKPAWVARVAWYVDEGERRLYFGVGVSPKLPDAAIQLSDLSGVEAKAGAPDRKSVV